MPRAVAAMQIRPFEFGYYSIFMTRHAAPGASFAREFSTAHRANRQ